MIEVSVRFCDADWPAGGDKAKNAWRLVYDLQGEEFCSAVGFGTKKDAEMVLEILKKTGKLQEWIDMPVIDNDNDNGEYDEIDKFMIEQLRW